AWEVEYIETVEVMWSKSLVQAELYGLELERLKSVIQRESAEK
ncbi:3909_t:CDS:1, partial [Acaulospora colombiana]